MDVCIICQKDITGKHAVPVKEDRIILGIRAVKQALNIAQNNKLYVCEGCVEEHTKRRKSFEKSMLFFGVLAVIVVVLLLVSMIFSGRFDLVAVLSMILIGVLMLLFSLLFKYIPATHPNRPISTETEVLTPGEPASPGQQQDTKKKINVVQHKKRG